MTISVRESGMPQTVSRNSPPHERPALDLETQPDEKRGHRVQVRNGDTDMIETSYT
jgi:hypothetical protein